MSLLTYLLVHHSSLAPTHQIRWAFSPSQSHLEQPPTQATVPEHVQKGLSRNTLLLFLLSTTFPSLLYCYYSHVTTKDLAQNDAPGANPCFFVFHGWIQINKATWEALRGRWQSHYMGISLVSELSLEQNFWLVRNTYFGLCMIKVPSFITTISLC